MPDKSKIQKNVHGIIRNEHNAKPICDNNDEYVDSIPSNNNDDEYVDSIHINDNIYDHVDSIHSNDGDDNDSIHGNKTNNSILISSEVTGNLESTGTLRFNIAAYVHINHVNLANKEKYLEININVINCETKDFHSKDLLSYKRSSDYFLDSAEVHIIPIENKSMTNKPLYKLDDIPCPQDMVKNWKINVDGCGRTGVIWRYVSRNHNDFNDRRKFAPGEHSCHLIALEAMSGFSIKISQVLRCSETGILHKYKLIKNRFPSMDHTLEISFNSLENLNKDYENFKKKNSEINRLSVNFVKNISPHRQKISNEKYIESITFMQEIGIRNQSIYSILPLQSDDNLCKPKVEELNDTDIMSKTIFYNN